jgi:hypothetical protein
MNKLTRLTIVMLASTLGTAGCTYYEAEHRAPETVVVAAPPERHGPPPWAPAHGYRHKTVYHYYQDCEVYHHAAAGNWIWLERGEWRSGGQLPRRLRRDLGPVVVIAVEGDRPWLRHQRIRHDHPPRRPGPPPPPHRGRGRRD